MSKNKSRNKKIQSIIKMMGSPAGLIVSIFAIIGGAFTAGAYYNETRKNIEILDIQKDNFKELKILSKKINVLELENRELRKKITQYEQEKKG